MNRQDHPDLANHLVTWTAFPSLPSAVQWKIITTEWVALMWLRECVLIVIQTPPMVTEKVMSDLWFLRCGHARPGLVAIRKE